MDHPVKIRTCLWMTTRGVDAARKYVALLPDSRTIRQKQTVFGLRCLKTAGQKADAAS
ncbi:hypothetical protein OS189_13670 [Sulfitobacter sp. F26169L]|uniref:hypothetical protein n=1 Tax=Sulfitobacter sp. F26169L TaxID=2996015 RepID=UPI0022608747|nr:hypothetical protein [Sulfitobacter sp. F26169L]MCX7567394.1 hypothetical protein [Sulfitobacter sp. F26169L]